MENSPIPVLHVITRLIVGGAQENTLYTAMLLDKKRYAVDVLSGPQTGSEGSLIEEGRSKGVNISILPVLIRQINPLMDMLALWKMIFIFRKKEYPIVHTHSSKAGILGRLAAKLAGVPIVIHTVHGWSFHDAMPPLTRKVYILLEQICARFTDALIIVTKGDREKGLLEGIGKPDQYHLIRSAIPLNEFNPQNYSRDQIRRDLGLPLDGPIVGTVGRFSAQKNPLEWVRVAEIIHREIPECCFLMVGDGPLRSQVESALVQLGLKERVLLPGISRNIPQLMAAMDVFLLTSRWEGLPRVIPQAMSMQLPVVATGVDGSAEVVMSGVNGFVCPPGDIDGLAKHCVNLLRDEQLRQKISQAGTRTVVNTFDLSQMIEGIDDLYALLIKKYQLSTGK